MTLLIDGSVFSYDDYDANRIIRSHNNPDCAMAPNRKSVMKAPLKQPQVRRGKVHANVAHSHAVMLQHFNDSEEDFQQAIADGSVEERDEGFYFVNPPTDTVPKRAPMKTMKAHAKAHATVRKKPAAVLKKPAAHNRGLTMDANATDADAESNDDETDDPHLKGKGVKFAKMRDELPQFVQDMYDNAARSAPEGKRRFRSKILSKLFEKNIDGSWKLTLSKPFFDEHKQVYEKKFGKVEDEVA